MPFEPFMPQTQPVVNKEMLRRVVENGNRYSGRLGFLWFLPKRPLRSIDFFKYDAENISEPVRLLIAAKALIDERKRWVQHRYLTLDGQRCAIGAVRAAAYAMNIADQDRRIGINLLNLIAHYRCFPDIEALNDKTNHTNVMNTFDEAILLGMRTLTSPFGG